MKIKLASAAMALAVVGAAPALATTIDYTVSGIASGNYTNGSTVTPFSAVNVTFQLYGDTTTLATLPGVATGLSITSGSMTASGILGSSPWDPSGQNQHFLVLQGAFAGFGIFGSPPYSQPATFDSPAFVGYDAFSNLGPVSIHYDGNVDPLFVNGADANFTAFTNVTFTARSVPEPATWAMMLVGLGGLGAVMRSVRRRQGVAAG